MHALSFGFKRAHWSAVRVGKLVLADVDGMTPARFDLLYLIRRVPLDEPLMSPGLTQDALWRALGVHPSTVSKMLAKLLDMGWVSRSRYSLDRRTWLIRLTDLGLRKIWQTMRILFRGRALLRAYEQLFPTGKYGHVVARIDRLVMTLKSVAYTFGDRSNVWFDYGCPNANVRLVRLTEPRHLRWLRLGRAWAQEKAMALLGANDAPLNQPNGSPER
jgi:DNA-binding MarR family transcriptional regulator